jgi:predicted nucleic acid-binding protein
MADTEGILVVLDAGPLIHLDELGAVHLLSGFSKLLVPTAVWTEAKRHRPTLQLEAIPEALVQDPADGRWAATTLVSGSHLHVGELAALSLLHELGGGLLLTDDDAARAAAEALGFSAAGTLGIILRAVRRGQISSNQARDIASRLSAESTLHLSRKVLLRFVAAIPD